MARSILIQQNIHPDIQDYVGGGHKNILDQVIKTVESNIVVVIGMRQNPVCKAVKKNLDKANIKFEYLEFGSYLSQWKRRLAIKLWSGWPTFPMVFVNGVLVGGNQEAVKLIESGEFNKLIERS